MTAPPHRCFQLRRRSPVVNTFEVQDVQWLLWVAMAVMYHLHIILFKNVQHFGLRKIQSIYVYLPGTEAKIQAKVYHKIVRLESILQSRGGVFPMNSLFLSPRKQITSLLTPLLEATTMSLEVAYNLSISDLLHVLNEKLGLESSKLRGISLPTTCSAGSLESEVSVPRWVNLDKELMKVILIDRRPGSQSAGCSEAHHILAEHLAAS